MLQAFQRKPSLSQCFIPVPMHSQRVKYRGFNHAAILAKRLALALNRTYDLTSCKKIVNTIPQAQLDGEQRQTNLRKAFYVDPLPFEHVTLIDDLLTTGSTANELALTLKKAGVKKVDIWCCARAIVKNR
jgi:ComF family protein